MCVSVRPYVEALKDSPVVVVSGGTGSGKSTQCPQYILEVEPTVLAMSSTTKRTGACYVIHSRYPGIPSCLEPCATLPLNLSVKLVSQALRQPNLVS